MEEIGLIKNFIKYIIEHNEFYESIYPEYVKDPAYFTNKIYDLFTDFFAEYSIYYIMDSIVKHMEQDGKTCREILEDSANFTLID